MSSDTIRQHRFIRDRLEADQRMVIMYNRYSNQVVRLVSYTGDNEYVNNVVSHFECTGYITVRQMYAAINIMKQLSGENVHSRPGARLKARRIESLTIQVRRLTAENKALRKQLRNPVI